MTPVALAGILGAAAGGPLPESLTRPAVAVRLAAERTWIDSLGDSAQEVYGVNRRPGHRDGEPVAVAGQVHLQREILQSHLVPSLTGARYGDFEVSCIGLAKATAVSLGRTGMTPSLYRQLLAALADPAFHPYVPCAQSYSSGDVIPGAHWARAVLDWGGYGTRKSLAPGEAMALINGNFVHVGLAAAAFPQLQRCGERLARAFAAIAATSPAPPATFERAAPAGADAAAPLREYVIARAAAAGCKQPPRVQVPVSVRAIPEVLTAYADAVEWLAGAVEQALATPSGNPLFDAQRQRVDSQASFLAPTLALAQGALVEALLLAAWTAVAHVQYLLGGQLAGVPVDAATTEDPLGLIQVPKAMMATLEDLRLHHGRRAFAAGAVTSRGVEDLWTHGEALSRAVAELAATVTALAERAWAVCEFVAHPETPVDPEAAPPHGAFVASGAIRALAAIERRLRGVPLVVPYLPWVPDGQGRAG